MQHKDLDKEPFAAETQPNSAPDLIQDLVDKIASHVSYTEGLAAFRQTSKTMNELIENTLAGQLAGHLRRNAHDHGKRYEKLVVNPISFLCAALAMIPTGVSIICLTPVILIPSPILNSSTLFLAGTRDYSRSISRDYRGMLAVSSSFFRYSHKKSQKMLLANTNKERNEIQDEQEIIRDLLNMPLSKTAK